MKKLANYFLALLVLALSLSACGGGGGGGGGSTTVTRTVTSISYSGQYQIYTYSDGTTQSNSPSSSSVSWASDHVTRTTTYTYSDGETNDVTDTVAATESYSYSGSTQTITYTYGDGYTSTSTNSATSSSVSWASDHVTRTTTYTYANGETNDVVDTVAGTETYSYSGSTQTITTTYGDGHVATSTSSATSTSYAPVTDDIEATYTFSNSETSTESVGFSWSNYQTYVDNQQFTLTTQGGYTTYWLESVPTSHSGTSMHESKSVYLTYSSGTIQSATLWGSLNATSGFSTYNTNFDYYSTTSAYVGDDRMIISKPGASYYNYSTFGIWNEQFDQLYAYSGVYFISTKFGGFFGGEESSSISAADGQTYTGQVVGMAVGNGYDAPALVTSDLSISVSGTTATFTASNSTYDGSSNSLYDFNGTATYSTYNGVAQLMGTAEFPNYTSSGTTLKGYIVGNFFGPNAEEIAGIVKSTGYSYGAPGTTYAAGYQAAFGAKR